MLNFRSGLQVEENESNRSSVVVFSDNSGDAPRTVMQSVSVQNLLRRIEDLEENMKVMEAKMVLYVKRYTVT